MIDPKTREWALQEAKSEVAWCDRKHALCKKSSCRIARALVERYTPVSGAEKRIAELEASTDESREKLAASELAMAQVRAAVKKEPDSPGCASFRCREFRDEDDPAYVTRVNIGLPCDCIKSRIPTGSDSALAEAVKRMIGAWSSASFVISDIPDEVLTSIDQMIALAPESWKHPEGGKE